MRRRTLASAIALLAMLTACGGGAHHPPPSGTASTPRPTATVTMHGGALVPLDVPNDVAARHDVSMGSCAGDSNNWRAGGTAANATSAPVTFEVTVFFTTPHATVLSSATTKVTTPAHGKAPWSAASRFQTGGAARCVLRGVAVVR